MTPPPRIGVLICTLAGGKEGALDLEALRKHAERDEAVKFSAVVRRACSPEGQSEALALLKAEGVDRFILAACSPRTKEPMFRRLASQAGLHPHGFETVNLREQCAYVHEGQQANEKSKRLLDMALAKMKLWTPPPYEDEQLIERRTVVIGDGLAASIAAHELAMHGVEVDMVMRTEGYEWPPDYLFADYQTQHRAEQTMMTLAIHPLVNMVQAAEVVGLRGRPGDFEITVSRYGEERAIKCGAIILAPNSDVDFRVLREGRLHPRRSEDLAPGATIAILPAGAGGGVACNCVSARAIHFALSLKERAPKAQIMLMGREVRALGHFETLYEQAQRQGVVFTRIESEPRIEGDGPYMIMAKEAIIGELAIRADTILVETSESPQLAALASMFNVPVDEKGDFLTLETRLRGAETVQRGVYACRVRMGNMMAEDAMLEAKTAASMAAGLLSQGKMEVGGEVAEVDADKCSACLNCARICPYGAPFFGQDGKAEIAIERCQGCGMCASLCPSKAIGMYGNSDEQLRAQAIVALREAR